MMEPNNLKVFLEGLDFGKLRAFNDILGIETE